MSENAQPAMTLKQKRVAALLADPKIKTVTETAAVLGVSRTTVQRAMRNGAVVEEIEKRTEKRLDRALSIGKLGERILRRGAEAADTLSPLDQIQAGGSMVKLSKDIGEDQVRIDADADEKYAETVLKAVLLGARLERMGRLQRGLELLDLAGKYRRVLVRLLKRGESRASCDITDLSTGEKSAETP